MSVTGRVKLKSASYELWIRFTICSVLLWFITCVYFTKSIWVNLQSNPEVKIARWLTSTHEWKLPYLLTTSTSIMIRQVIGLFFFFYITSLSIYTGTKEYKWTCSDIRILFRLNFVWEWSISRLGNKQDRASFRIIVSKHPLHRPSNFWQSRQFMLRGSWASKYTSWSLFTNMT